MKRTGQFVTALVLVILAAATLISAQEQTLADRARAAKAAKAAASAKKVITNDTLGIVAKPGESQTAEAGGESAGAPGDSAGGDKSPEDMRKLTAEWTEKINKVKEDIAFLERETTVAGREAQIRAAEFYGTAGNRLQNEQKWLEDQKKSQSDTDAKKKALADAKSKLEDYRDQARRAGVPANQIP